MSGDFEMKIGERYPIRLEYVHERGSPHVWVRVGPTSDKSQTLGLLGELFPEPPPAEK